MLNRLKRLLLRVLPSSVLRAYKKRRFLSLVKNFNAAD